MLTNFCRCMNIVHGNYICTLQLIGGNHPAVRLYLSKKMQQRAANKYIMQGNKHWLVWKEMKINPENHNTIIQGNKHLLAVRLPLTIYFTLLSY